MRLVKKSKLFLILLLSVLLCFIASSCLSFISGFELAFNNALDTSDIENREVSYDIDDEITTTFYDGNLYAVWNENEDYDYTIVVEKDGEETTVTADKVDNGKGYANLNEYGFTFSDDLEITVNQTQRTLFGTNSSQISYDYNGISASVYDEYVKPVSAGFKEIDRYIATRSEWFDFWSYMIIFRENAEYVDGCYEMTNKVYMAYDYQSLYKRGTTVKDAFSYEVYSAIDAYEDSAAYTYTYEMDKNGNEGVVYMNFYYETAPKYTSNSGEKYVNAVDNEDKVHYSVGEIKNREFPIDKVANVVSVKSSDQLYFAMKKGYRPIPEKGSNAEYVYNEMRRILACINLDMNSDAEKVHNIYDYLVNTVIYDYDFTESIYDNDDVSTYQLFSYQCMYIEGVLGLKPNKTFDENYRIAICDGLSKTFLCMAMIEGIDCLKISGYVNEEGHAWNKVYVNEKWYMVDVTWGNNLEEKTGKEYLSHDYLMVPDDSYHVESEYYNYPDATSRYYFGGDVDNNPNDDDVIDFPFFPFRPSIFA